MKNPRLCFSQPKNAAPARDYEALPHGLNCSNLRNSLYAKARLIIIQFVKHKPPSRLSWLLPAGFAAAIVVTYCFILAPASSKMTTAAPSAASSAGVSLGPATATGLDLVGAVKDAGGQAIANATIFIYTAQPRSGPGFL